jgi:hypothetical protein
MERVIAIKRLGKMLGKSLGYRIDPKAPAVEEREAAKAQLPALIAERKAADEAVESRRKELLADPQYQELKAAAKAASDKANRVSYTAHHHYKITVGTSNNMFFLVRAQGDSWEEVIEKLDAELSGRKAA